MSNHTPGPWSIEFGGGHAYNRIVGSESIHTNGKQRNKLGISSASYSERVCENLGDLNLPGPSANANLIASAPDLLEALENIENDDGSIPETIWNMRNTAIAKARGEL